MRSPSLTSLAAIESLIVKRTHKFTEERLRAYKFRPRIGIRKPRYAHQRLKPPDPLLNSVDAQIFSLPEIKRGLFVVRPPPTPVPPEIGLPISARALESHDLSHPLAAGAGGPFDGLPTPKLRHGTDELLAPAILVSKRRPVVLSTVEPSLASESQSAPRREGRRSTLTLADRAIRRSMW